MTAIRWSGILIPCFIPRTLPTGAPCPKGSGLRGGVLVVKHRWRDDLPGGLAAFGWAGVLPELAHRHCRFGGNGGEAGVRAPTEIEQALWDLRLIMLGYLEACLDSVHYPPPGPDPGSGISGRTLVRSHVSAALGVSHVPKPLRLRGDETCVQATGDLQRTGAR